MVKRVTRNGQEFVIRPVRSGDAERLYLFIEGLLPDSRRLFRPHEFTRDDAERVIRDADGERATRLLVVTPDEDAIAGYGYFSEAGVMDARAPLLGIAIADRYQNQGLGRILMQTLNEEARAQGKSGMQLTVYKENDRAIHLYAALGFRIVGEADGGKQHAMRLDFPPAEGVAALRGVFLDAVPWGLAGLTPDAWTVPEWLSYIDFLRTAGANLLQVSIWPSQYYHPDVPATLPNAWRCSVLRQALEHARSVGMTTYIGFNLNGVPPGVWLAHTNSQAREIGYRGVGLCWTQAREEIRRFPAFLMSALADSTDGFVMRVGGPAFCSCPACHNYARVVCDAAQEYAALLGDRGTFHLDLTDACGLEARLGGSFCASILPVLSKERFALVEAGDEETRARLGQAGIPCLLHDTRLDGPSDLDPLALMTRPRLRQVDRIAAQNSEFVGVLGHRMMPCTQFATDFVLMQRLLFPGRPNHEVLQHLGGRLYTERPDVFGFARALWALDSWWDTGLRSHLSDARDALDALPPDRLGMVGAVRDTTRLLHDLVLYLERGERHFDALVARVHGQMAESPAFRGFTIDQVWQARARAVVAASVTEWLAALREHLDRRH